MLGLLASVLLPASAASAADDVGDFDYSSWTSRYELSLDEHGRAVAHVTETLVAEFPDSDQNKGIVRGYPERYEGAGLDLQIVSVTDAEGRDVPYETDSDDGVLYVLTGDDSYVHGRTTYVIESTMRDLLVHGSETGNDEFYWDLLPFDSSQSIGSFRADIVLSPELAEALTGDAACYQGKQGSTRTCGLEKTDADGEGATFTVISGERPPGDGVTVAIGFEAGTVTQPPARSADPVTDLAPLGATAGALAAGIGSVASVVLLRRRRRRATGIVIAQYDVPVDMPPLVAAPLIPGAEHPVPAQIVHLAVHGALRIEESSADGKEKQPPLLRLLDRAAAVTDLDRRTLSALFGKSKTERRIPQASEKFAANMSKLLARGVTEAETRGWMTKERSRAAAVFGWVSVAVLAVAAVLLVRAIVLDRELLPLAVVATVFTGIITILTLIMAFAPQPVLTPEGARWHEYLMGVREFIRVAEADRIRMLQSHTGAERRAEGDVDVVVLYERLLPYAMLLGEEKSWAKVLEQTYARADASPGWMDAGHGAGLSLWVSSFANSTQSASSYTSPSSSSSSGAGGSTGGGFSGGGGGGGFSGGR